MPKHVLLITQTVFFPSCYEGVARRLQSFITFFRSRGTRVTVLHQHDPEQASFADYDRMSDRCDRLVVYYPTQDDLAVRASGQMDAWCPLSFVEIAHQLVASSDIDCVIGQYVFSSRCFEGLPCGVVKVLDADTVFRGRADVFRSAGIAYTWFTTDQVQERTGLRRADLILAAQKHEAAYLRAESGRPVLTIPPVWERLPHDDAHRGAVVFVGAGIPENVRGIQEFIRTAWPTIAKAHPDVELLVAGAVCRYLEPCDAAGVRILGVLDDLTDFYGRATIALNTTWVGTGLKTKSAEALCHGACLVTTPAGATGLERFADGYIVAATYDDFVKEIDGLLNAPDKARQLARTGLAWAATYFDPIAILSSIESAVEAVATGRPVTGSIWDAPELPTS